LITFIPNSKSLYVTVHINNASLSQPGWLPPCLRHNGRLEGVATHIIQTGNAYTIFSIHLVVKGAASPPRSQGCGLLVY